jgi:hypothetical protein
MSTASEREAALRRALLSAAEYIEPAPGGLQRIQERLGRPRPLLIARLEAAWTVVLMRAPDIIEALRRKAANLLRLVWDRFGPKSEPGPGRHGLRWLRPLVAMSVAVFVVGAGVYVGLQSPTMLFQTGGVSGANTIGGSHASGPARTGPGTTEGSGSPPPYSASASTSASSPACQKKTNPPRFQAPGPSASTSSQPTTPATSTSTGTSTSPPPTPSVGTSSSPSSSTPPSSGGSADTPGAGLPSGNPASVGGNAVTVTGASAGTTDSARRGAEGASASHPAAPSPATTGKSRPSAKSQKLPCQATKPKGRHHKKTSSASTSAKLMHTQPGRTVSAKLD